VPGSKDFDAAKVFQNASDAPYVGLINSRMSRRHAEAPMLFLLIAVLFDRL
jgi:hypothetical protein